jgi:hypothetical protein
VPITPAIREFLHQLEELLDARARPGLDRDAVSVTTGDAVALVVLGHRDGQHAVEVQIDDREIRINYSAEPVVLRDRSFALRLIEALLDGRVEVETRFGPLWRTNRSYLDGAPQPFLTTRMPYPSLRPRTERRRVGFT